MGTLLALVMLAACPDEKPIDLSAANKSGKKSLPDPRVPAAKPRPTMPEGPLPVELPVVTRAPSLALAPEIVIFAQGKILRKPTSSTETYGGTPTPYIRPTSVTPVGVAGRLDDSAGAIALFVNASSSAIETLYLLDDLKIAQVSFAVESTGRGQLRYQFGAADASARDRLQIVVADDELVIGEETFSGNSRTIGKPIADAVAARRAQSTIGIEARVGVRSGTTNQRMAEVLDELAIAKVEAVYLVPVQDSIPHSSTSYANRSGGIPRVSIGQPNAQGDLDKAIIRRYMKRNIMKITYCYEKELLSSPDLAGTVIVQFFISPDGKVATSSASGLSPRVSACVAGVIKSIEFPKPKGGGGVQVNYPFTMRPNGG
jgi:hypothetical protein